MTYTVIRQLGRGGFGIFEEVKNICGERFARKTFSPAPHIDHDAHDKLRNRFKREVKLQTELGGREIRPVLASDLDWSASPIDAAATPAMATSSAVGIREAKPLLLGARPGAIHEREI